MASTREERLEQRLRGGRIREVKDVDFGFSIQTPIQEPPNVAVQQSPDGETPAGRSRGRPAKITSIAKTPLQMVHSANDANTSAKRRKLDTEMDRPSSRSARSSQRAPRQDIYDIEVQEEEPPADRSAQAPDPELVVAVSQTLLRNARTPSVAPLVSEEITESPRDEPGSGKRRRIGLDTENPSLTSSESILEGNTTKTQTSPIPQRKRKRRQAVLSPVAASIPETLYDPIPKVSTPHDELDELSPEQPKRRGRRPQAAVAGKYLPQQPEEGEEEADGLIEETEYAEEIDDQEAAARSKKDRGRRISRDIPVQSPDLDELSPPSASTAVKKQRKRIEASPIQQRHPKKAISNVKPGGLDQRRAKKAATKDKLRESDNMSQKTKTQNASPIPIIVHRLTKAPIHDGDELSADILNSDIPYARRGGVNPIDVLSQICQESVASGLDALDSLSEKEGNSALRREYRTKCQAIEAFGRELQTYLLEHTINLDNTYALERRVRDEQKRKIGLREEILRIRAEREQAALQMDDIRIKHEAATNDAQEVDSLNITIHDVELAVEFGKAKQARDSIKEAVEMTGLELLLKRISSEASTKSDSGGILKQVKEFNAFLERAALALESRKS
ncbi:hypothetical protein B7494_g483 [Chlorociboria aeruginascens]|nr:hypothetical protein B7494_g483 [Chlorociboria aeruginascens]